MVGFVQIAMLMEEPPEQMTQPKHIELFTSHFVLAYVKKLLPWAHLEWHSSHFLFEKTKSSSWQL